MTSSLGTLFVFTGLHRPITQILSALRSASDCRGWSLRSAHFMIQLGLQRKTIWQHAFYLNHLTTWIVPFRAHKMWRVLHKMLHKTDMFSSIIIAKLLNQFKADRNVNYSLWKDICRDLLAKVLEMQRCSRNSSTPNLWSMCCSFEPVCFSSPHCLVFLLPRWCRITT